MIVGVPVLRVEIDGAVETANGFLKGALIGQCETEVVVSVPIVDVQR